jgi:hypothetical protein
MSIRYRAGLPSVITSDTGAAEAVPQQKVKGPAKNEPTGLAPKLKPDQSVIAAHNRRVLEAKNEQAKKKAAAQAATDEANKQAAAAKAAADAAAKATADAEAADAAELEAETTEGGEASEIAEEAAGTEGVTDPAPPGAPTIAPIPPKVAPLPKGPVSNAVPGTPQPIPRRTP